MWKSDRTSAPHQAEVFSFRMTVKELRCKECGTGYPLDARFVCEQCFGPLEVAYDFSGLDAAEAKRKIQAGSHGIWRYADFLPFESAARTTRSSPASPR